MIQLLSILQDTFAREPPLVAKQQQIQPLPPTPQNDATGPPIPPLPPERGRHDYGPPSAREIRSEHAAPPPPPPKTTVGEDKIPSKYDRPAPLPPGAGNPNSYPNPQMPPQPNGHAHRPPSNPINSSQANAQLGRSTQGPYATAHRDFPPPHELTSPPNPRAPGPPTQHRSFQSPTPFYPPQQQHTKTYGPPDQLQHQQNYRPPDPRSMSQPPQQYQTPPFQSYGTQQPPPSTTRPAPKPAPSIDLLTSPFDTPLPTTSTATTTPPPIPPNPQKDALLSTLSQTLTSQIRSTHQTTHSAIPPLLAQQRALTTTLSSLNAEIAQLESLDSLLTSNERILHKAMHDADRVLEDAKRRKVPDVDDVLVAPTVVAGQLYGAVAEQRAIEDCRAVLGKALDRGRVGAGVWARQTRSLAREEFLKKALVKKIGRGMGLVEEGAWS
ncbi:MAG: Suppressor protein stp22 of temperature-sensitive alpha-factor receptor and arginine permease [Ramalina farinacea]|uniref:Suppressor protein stp22 of temperature-sensitive alpha-factor receptor and arginine permease n=1 Tax=Ramalina farinacea TaxID=258253 RepID=A0AA43QLD6_9LECA|nr:Suppressor protein stp22 of temperature-sensitive alpha-factor receptor and arginine permease [Ramalina farinacea]